MKRKFSALEVQKVDELNSKLIAIEERIFHLAEEEYLRVEKMLNDTDQKMDDYDLQVLLAFSTSEEQDEYGDDLEFIHWEESVYFESFEEGESFGINDKQCHNVTRGLIDNEALNAQKHCWLLHRLYDDYFVRWEDILRIDRMYFEIKVGYEYEVNLEEVKI